MFPNLSPGAVGIGAPIEEAAKLAADAGFKGIDVDLGETRKYGISKMKDLLAVNDLRVGGWGLPVEFRKDDETFSETLRLLPEHAAAAVELGTTRCSTWVLSGSDELPFEEHFALLRGRFRECGNILNDYGCSLGLEFLGPKTIRDGFAHEFIYTLPGMLELCDAIGTGNMGLLLDCWHWYTSGGDLAQVQGLRPEQVVYVHVNDAPVGVARDEQIDNVRDLPMATGVIDLPGFLKALDAIGYDGPVTPEPFCERLSTMASQDIAAAVAAGMKQAWSDAGLAA